MLIESTQNQRVKQLLQLQQKAKIRKKEQLFVVEGVREITLALQNNYELVDYFYCNSIVDSNLLKQLQEQHEGFEVSSKVFDKIAYRDSGGVVATFRPKRHTLETFDLEEKPFFIILESVEKPGNLGAILRTADAAAVTAVFVCDPLVDIYNPNVIRASLGCLFSVTTIVCQALTLYNWLQKNNIKSYTSYLHQKTVSYYQVSYNQACAIVLGTEADGVSNFWITHADTLIKIPMLGQIDSLNVSNAAAIIVYEALRQRL